MKKILIAPDSFKGNLSAVQICDIVARAVCEVYPDCELDLVPIGNGGEGTVKCFQRALGGEIMTKNVTGPLFQPVDARYLLAGDMAVIEMAASSGLPLVEGEKQPDKTTTFGVGQLIRDAADRGAKQILLGLGGSATNDGGCGAAAALGARFFDKRGKEFIPVGGTLGKIERIDIDALEDIKNTVELSVMCDIDNPLFGQSGAAYVFGPQKGADEKMVALLDSELISLNETFKRCLGRDDIAATPGAGAAGGMGAGMMAFFGVGLQSGIETVLDTVRFDERLRGADLVITGEGRIDAQSLRGKVVVGVGERAKGSGVPVIAVVGDITGDLAPIYERGITAVFTTNRTLMKYDEIRRHSKAYLHDTVLDAMRFARALRGE